MRSITINQLKSVPPSCINRDENNEPKVCEFGGVLRSRWSSQNISRYVRAFCRELFPDLFCGQRTKEIVSVLKSKFDAILPDNLKGESEKIADESSTELFFKSQDDNNKKRAKNKKAKVAKNDAAQDGAPENNESDTQGKSVDPTVLYVSNAELDCYAREIVSKIVECGDISKGIKSAVKFIKHKDNASIRQSFNKDAVDIALNGRFMSSSEFFTVESATLRSHALTTHERENEPDFFTCLDDVTGKSVHLGQNMFNSGCFYRVEAINLDLLKKNLGLPDDDVKKVVFAWIKATILAQPEAKQYSMFSATQPSYVLAIVRDGNPETLVNAFEQPVKADKDGYIKPSVQALNDELSKQKKYWQSPAKLILTMDDCGGIDEFCNKVVEASFE